MNREEPRLSVLDRTLLDEIQEDLPLVSRPFAVLARRCGLSESELLRRLTALAEGGWLREISPVLDPGRIGYRVVLAAARVPPERVEEVAARINAHAGVSHNYLREHPWNLWFTLALRGESPDFETEVRQLVGGSEIPFLLLPSIRTFKIGVRLRFDRGEEARTARRRPAAAAPLPGGSDGKAAFVPLSDAERDLLRVLQEPLALKENPWAGPARQLGLEEGELLQRVHGLKRKGAIRRISGVLRHRRAGFLANGLACFRVAEERLEPAGRTVAGFAEVSHCYQRLTHPQWPYPLYAMIHARTRAECDELVQRVARRIDSADTQVLYSVRELKKTRIRYFREES